jgi:hypothetical protein
VDDKFGPGRFLVWLGAAAVAWAVALLLVFAVLWILRPRTARAQPLYQESVVLVPDSSLIAPWRFSGGLTLGAGTWRTAEQTKRRTFFLPGVYLSYSLTARLSAALTGELDPASISKDRWFGWGALGARLVLYQDPQNPMQPQVALGYDRVAYMPGTIDWLSGDGPRRDSQDDWFSVRAASRLTGNAERTTLWGGATGRWSARDNGTLATLFVRWQGFGGGPVPLVARRR